MIEKTILIFLMIISSWVSNSQENNLIAFKELIGKNWKAQGEWENGTIFKQEIIFEYSLDSTIVIVKSKGFTDMNQTKYGLRNHGIRQFDKTLKKIKFWEFDVFGKLTTGEIEVEGDNLFYIYNYNNTVVTDAWIKIDDKTYQFIVGARKDGKWIQKYLETKFLGTELN